MLLPKPLVRIEAPTTALTTLNEQPDENRCVLHLLHYVPERRGQDFDVIEDIIPIFNVKVSVKAPKKTKNVLCVPGRMPLDFSVKAGYVQFALPKLRGHQMIELSFA